MLYTDPKTKIEAKVCKEWVFDTFKALFYSKIVSLSINLINFILKTLLIITVKQIGEETIS